MINVDDESLRVVKNALTTAGESYKKNLTRLTNLINEITSGDIQGNAADDLLQKFQAKEATLKNIAKSIDEAEEYMQQREAKFNQLMGDLKAGMK